MDFQDVWCDVKDFLSANKVVRICGVGDVTVVDFSDEGVSVMTKESSEPEFIDVKWIREVWHLLAEKGMLCADDLVGGIEAGFWSSFILSLLSYQPYVGYIIDAGRNCYTLNEKP
ncbi:MAG: hypothetical protein JW778_01010 [Candidatus Altiarchaeota archaeon]|nr:hypothetical protein [Candidatus Altiarchaeota archaeon]